VKKDIREAVQLQKINLQSLTAVRNDITDDSFNIYVKFDQDIKKDDNNKTHIQCSLEVGNEQQPFTINLLMNVYFKKLDESTSGDEILKNMERFYFPILSEASLVIAQATASMNYPPLIISPKELLKQKEEKEKTEDS